MRRAVPTLLKWKSAAIVGPRWQRQFVPLLEVAEVLLTHGPREVVTRVGRRMSPRHIAPIPDYFPRRHEDAALTALSLPPLDSTVGVSIVIPVWNQAHVTHDCLRAILANTPSGRYEVIVVDNHSDAGTQAMLAEVSGLRCIRNDRNLGFIEACNQGAGVARGKHLVFLNNDTAVLPGWLDALIGTLEGRGDAGAVGAKLLYPDGRLQEAGSIVWRDGSAWNYGKHGNSEDPAFNYVRPVDYCSAACLATTAEAWFRLQGFDNVYSPAYYEDTDYCFRLREHGYSVYFQPAARVVHLEGTTAGTDESAGFKQFQGRNRNRFAERHRAALREQFDHDPRLLFRARDRRMGLRILVVDDMVPHHNRNSGSVRATAILRILVELGHAVSFLPDNLERSEPYSSQLQQLGVEVLYGPMSSRHWADQHLHYFDVVILCRAYIAAKYLTALEATRPRPFVVFDTVDLHFLREERRADLEPSAARRQIAARTRQQEFEVMRASDMVWVTSTHEADVLADVPDAKMIRVVPNIHESVDAVAGFKDREGILFIGGFRHPPNEDAILTFVANIWPSIASRLPHVRLHIVGGDVPSSVQVLASPQIVVHGHVPDVKCLFETCRLSVAPLRYGAGVKGKVSQSLILGLPVVTSSVGAEGMALNHGQHALIADREEDFARHVLELYSDEVLWNRLSQEGREHARRTQGYEMARDRIREALSLVPTGSATRDHEHLRA